MIQTMTSESPHYVPNALLSRLVGLRLLAVEFVLDYLQLRFDGDSQDPQPIMTCEAWPDVELPNASVHRNGAVGYADALRGLVGGSVLSTDERTGVGLRVDLDGGTIHLHPSVDEIPGPEIAMLRGFADQSWMCWRPGEESFEDLV
jgi:hypothetical protein